MPTMSYMAVQLIVNGYYYREDAEVEDLRKSPVPVDDGEEYCINPIQEAWWYADAS